MQNITHCPKCRQPLAKVCCPHCTEVIAWSPGGEETRSLDPQGTADFAPPKIEEAPTVPPKLGNAETIDAPRGINAPSKDGPLPDIAGYEILGILGRGGMGVVYKARHSKLKRLVALKMIVAGAHAGPDQIARFQSEAEAVARLQHPNIVQIYEVGNQDGLPFFSLEFVEGGSLDRQLLGNPQNPRAAAELVLTLAKAISAAHRAGIIHRDLKPANILMTKEGTPKITDFGLAKQLDSSSGHTQSGAIVGTPSYMAPEQAAGDTRTIGPAADIYALGTILYEMLTGRPPFKGATPMETVMQVVVEEPVPPLRLQPNLPRDLDTICLKCLHKAPEKRYASGAALAEDLQHFLAGEPIQARPVGTPERLWRWCKRKPALAAASGLAAFGLLVALGIFAGAYFVVSDALNNETKERKNAQKLAKDNKLLAEKEEQARLDAVEDREKAEAESIRVKFNHYLSRAEERPDLALVGMAHLLPQAARLKNRSVADMLRLQVAAWSRHTTRLNLRNDTGGQYFSLSTDGKVALTGKFGEATLWDTETGKQIGPQLQGAFQHVVLSADGKSVLTVSDGLTARLWETATGKPIGRPLQHAEVIFSVSLSSDGKTALTDTRNNLARVWNTTTGKLIGPPLQHQERINGLALSADGKVALTVVGLFGIKGEFQVGTVRLWDVVTGAPIGPPLKHRGPGFFPTVSADGKAALTTSDGTSRVWDSVTGKPGPPFRNNDWVVLSADYKTALTNDGEAARLWDTTTGKQIGPPLKHQGGVIVVALSADGKTALTGSDDKTARLWDTATGKPIGQPLEHQDLVLGLALSADGKTAMTGNRGTTVRIWNTATGTSVGPLEQAGKVGVVVALSADGKVALTGGGDLWYKTARLWDAVTGLPKAPPLQHEGGLDAALSVDGKMVITGSDDKTARLWDTAEGKRIGLPLYHENPVIALALNADGSKALTVDRGPLGRETRARLWDTVAGELVGAPLELPEGVTSLALSGDGKTAITGCNDKAARSWNVATGKPIGPPLKHEKSVTAVALSADGKRALTVEGFALQGATARLWDAATGTPIGPPLRHKGSASAAAFSANGKVVLTQPHEKTAQMWDAATGEPIGTPILHEIEVTAAALSDDGMLAVTVAGGGGDWRRESSTTTCLWNTATGKPIGRPIQYQGNPHKVALSADGKTILTWGVEKTTARIWDTTTRKPIGPPLAHQSLAFTGILSADGKIAMGLGRNTIMGIVATHFWNTVTGTPLGAAQQHGVVFDAFALSADGKTALTGSVWANLANAAEPPIQVDPLADDDDKAAHLWNTTTGVRIGSPLQHESSVHRVALSADGKTALTVEGTLLQGGTARIWQTATGKPIGLPFRHPEPIDAVALSADGKTALAASRDKTARLWQTETGSPIGPPLQHLDKVIAVALSADGKTVLTGSQDNTARLWDTVTHKPIGPPLQHRGWVTAVALSADGKVALTGSNDYTARLWDTATGIPIGAPLQHQRKPITPRVDPLVAQGVAVGVTLSADGKMALTSFSGNAYAQADSRLWKVPQPIRGDPERIMLWTQVITGLEVDDLTSVRVLDAATWQQRRQRLQELGGPPEID